MSNNLTARDLGLKIKSMFSGNGAAKPNRHRCDLVCWALVRLGGMATRAQLCEFWRAVTGVDRIHERRRWVVRDGRYQLGGTIRAHHVQLHSLLSVAYGGVTEEGFVGSFQCYPGCRSSYAGKPPFLRVRRGVYTLTLAGHVRAARAASLVVREETRNG